IVLRSQAVLLTIVALGAGALWLAGRFGTGGVAGIVIWLAPGLVLVVLAWNLLVWLSRAYRLTSRRLIRSAGVLNRSTMEIPLERIQHLEVHRTWAERLLGLGSLGFSTAGGAWREMVWVNIDRPYNRLNEIR